MRCSRARAAMFFSLKTSPENKPQWIDSTSENADFPIPPLAILSCLEKIVCCFLSAVIPTTVFAMFICGQASAQSGVLVAVAGTVSDSTGAVVASATVTITNEGTGAARTTQTDSSGFYAVESLDPGTYTVTVTAPGFKVSTTKGEILFPGQRRESNAVLSVGASTQEVTVQANAVQVETESSESSGTITGKEVSNLMLNGRNFQALGQLVPGVSSTQSGVALSGGGFTESTTLIVNGNSVEYTVYTIDGVEDMNTGNLAGLNVLPIIDAVDQFTVMKDNYSARYGWSGSGQVVIQTKAGTNTYHGSAWDYLRNDVFDANNYFDTSKAFLQQNIYGFTLGGPVPKLKKTFFFAANEWRKANTGVTQTGAVFTQAMRGGNFGASPTLPAGGLTLDANSQMLLAEEGHTNCVLTPTTLNPSCLNPVATTLYADYVPQENNPGGGFNNYLNQGVSRLNELDYNYRIDHSFTPNETFTARVIYEKETNAYPYDAWAGFPYTTTTNSENQTGSNIILRMNSAITPKFDNVANVAYSDDKPRIQNTSGNTALPSGLSIVQAYPGADPLNRIPNVSISSGYTGLGVSTQPIHASDGEGILSDDVSWVKGNHVLQAGAVYVFGIKRQNVFTYPQGEFTFTGVHTGDPAADYLLGLDATYLQDSSQKSGSYHYRQGEAYFQDDWKPTPKLTLNLGLRWFYYSPNTVSGDQVTNFDPASFQAMQAPVVTLTGTLMTNANNVPITSIGTPANLTNGLLFAGQNGTSSGFFSANKKAFAPRVGFAYAIGNDSKTSIRGGYGVGYTREAVEEIYAMFGQNPPFNSSTSILNSLISNGTAGSAGAPTPATLNGIDTSSVGPAQTQSFSFSLERQVLPPAILTIAYAGSVSRHLETQSYNPNQSLPVTAPSTAGCLAANQTPSSSYQFDPCINSGKASPYFTVPYPGYAVMSWDTFRGSSNYNALQAHFVYRTTTLHADLGYTWSKVLTDLGGSGGASGNTSIGAGAQQWSNLAAEYGPPDWDRTNVLSLSTVYDLPFFKNSDRMLRTALGGWSWAGLGVLESGFALSPGLSTSANGNATRPDAIGHEQKIGKRNEWFNTSDYVQAPNGFYGDATNGSIRGPAEFTGNTALYKTFPIHEKVNLQFRAEAFNVANHPNWNAVSTDYGAGNFGAVTSALDPRILEFAVRATF
jgi:Carboxypeptidase regulatory-like domain/TonB-dependent Receptor Plug Domain/TonB dependent receptor